MCVCVRMYAFECLRAYFKCLHVCVAFIFIWEMSSLRLHSYLDSYIQTFSPKHSNIRECFEMLWLKWTLAKKIYYHFEGLARSPGSSRTYSQLALWNNKQFPLRIKAKSQGKAPQSLRTTPKDQPIRKELHVYTVWLAMLKIRYWHGNPPSWASSQHCKMKMKWR